MPAPRSSRGGGRSPAWRSCASTSTSPPASSAAGNSSRAWPRSSRRRGCPPDRLVLEITESGVMRNPEEALATMVGLRDLGVSPRAGRLRHRALLARTSPGVPDRHVEDRTGLRHRPARKCRRRSVRRDDRAAGRLAGARRRRRGDRVPAAGGRRRRSRVRVRAGLSLRGAAGSSRRHLRIGAAASAGATRQVA